MKICKLFKEAAGTGWTCILLLPAYVDIYGCQGQDFKTRQFYKRKLL